MEKDIIYNKKAFLFISLILLMSLSVFTSCTLKEKQVYDNAKIENVKSEGGTKIGEYSIIEMPSNEVTHEIIEDWYFNYVIKDEYKWYMIVYSDMDNKEGIYSSGGMVSTDAKIEKDKLGHYVWGGYTDTTKYYFQNNDQTLREYNDTK